MDNLSPEQNEHLLLLAAASLTPFRVPTREEINAKYEPYEELMARFARLDELNYEEVCKFEDDFSTYASWFRRANGSQFTYLPNGMWPGDFKLIAERKRTLSVENDPKAKLFYEYKLIIEDEEINGYKLWNIDGQNVLDFEDFKEICELWEQPDITEEEFREGLDKNLCSDWAKQDRHGECFGGFWAYPEGSDEKINAYTLSRQDNIEGLCELPYPRNIIIKTCEWGCNSRMESVAYSNFLCEWIKRKKDVVFCNEVPSLQSIARAVAEKQTDLPPYLL